MQSLYEFLRNLQLVVFVGLGLAALYQWRRTMSEGAAWLAASFCTLGVVVLVARFVPIHSEDVLVEWIRKIQVSILVFFPYFLWRFALTFLARVKWFWIAAHVLTVGLAVGILFFPEVPERGEPRSLAFQIYVLALLVQWVALSLRVAVRLWKAGKGQPTVARRRMRTLSLGSVGLAAALVLAGAAPGEDAVSGTQIVTQTLALLSGPFFLMGFAPPALVRMSWRRPEEEALREAELGLMQATDSVEVADVLLPHVAHLVGGSSSALYDVRGNVISSYGYEDPASAANLPERAEESEGAGLITMVPLESGQIAVAASPFSPFFGREEEALFNRLALLADLALARVQLLAALRRSNQELEQFAYVASHDLQEPLRTVASYAEMLSNKLEDKLDDKTTRYIHYVVDGCSRMQTLINDLLDFSRVGTRGQPLEPTDLKDALDEALRNLSLAIEESRTVIEADGLPMVRADRDQLSLVFQNLISNSIKFSGNGSPRVRVQARAGQGEWLLSVEDRGIGIDPKYADRIFTIFQRLHTRDEYPGTGIGLAICKKIVERHGGRMWLDPKVEKGSRFCFTLPMIEEGE